MPWLKVPGDFFDRLALEEMLAPNPTNRLHCQHSPTARFESKRAAHQAQWEGVNFGRRSPSSGGQNCTPNNKQSRIASATRATGLTVGCIARSSRRPARNVFTPG